MSTDSAALTNSQMTSAVPTSSSASRSGAYTAGARATAATIAANGAKRRGGSQAEPRISDRSSSWW
jgi:hypothetical protein